MTTSIRVLVARPNEPPDTEIISNDLDTLHKLVDGWVESIRWSPRIYMLFNDGTPYEGKMLPGDAPGRTLHGVGWIRGTVVFVKAENDEFTSLTPEDIKFIRDRITPTEIWR